MRVAGDVTGDLASMLEEERHAIAAGLRRGMEAAATTVQADLRSQVRGAGLGAGLEKAWQKQTYPKNAGSHTLSPAALVFSKATLLHQVFAEGATITASSGRYLAIPTKDAEALGLAEAGTTRGGNGVGGIARRRSMVTEAIQRLGAANIVTLPTAKGRKLIAYKIPTGRGPGKAFRVRGGRSVAFRRGALVGLFILVPQVRLRPRLDIAGARQRAENTLAAELASALAAA